MSSEAVATGEPPPPPLVRTLPCNHCHPSAILYHSFSHSLRSSSSSRGEKEKERPRSAGATPAARANSPSYTRPTISQSNQRPAWTGKSHTPQQPSNSNQYQYSKNHNGYTARDEEKAGGARTPLSTSNYRMADANRDRGQAVSTPNPNTLWQPVLPMTLSPRRLPFHPPPCPPISLTRAASNDSRIQALATGKPADHQARKRARPQARATALPPRQRARAQRTR